jgi:hypothetical protein
MAKLVLTTTFRGDEVLAMVQLLRAQVLTGEPLRDAQTRAYAKLVRMHAKWIHAGSPVSKYKARIPKQYQLGKELQ